MANELKLHNKLVSKYLSLFICGVKLEKYDDSAMGNAIFDWNKMANLADALVSDDILLKVIDKLQSVLSIDASEMRTTAIFKWSHANKVTYNMQIAYKRSIYFRKILIMTLRECCSKRIASAEQPL